MTHKAILIAVNHGRHWHVEIDGQRIVSKARDPEHTACRAMLAMGMTAY